MLTNRKKYIGYRVDKVLRMRGNKQNAGTGIIFTDVESGEVIIGKKEFAEAMGIGIGALSHKILRAKNNCFEEPIEVNGKKFTYTKQNQ
jgi:hypothetical protein